MIEGHGDDLYLYKQPIVSNFSSNVCCDVDLSGLEKYLCNKIHSITNYPEPEPFLLEKKLGAYHHIPAENVCVTNGATEAIYLIAQTFRESNTAIFIPTFSEYADACHIHDHRIIYMNDMENIPEDINMVWICNPNNPTGLVYERNRLQQLITNYPKACFVIDQSYEYFTEKELFSSEEALNYPNVMLIHSMTKRYAIPGLRLGYITASTQTLKRIRANRMPWSVNQLAIEAGLYILEKEIPHSFTVKEYLNECTRLRKLLEAIGELKVYPGDTTFMLVKLLSGKVSALKNYLANEHGLLIRDASNFRGLDGQYFRIATQMSEENNLLVEYINQWLQR